MYKDVGRFEIPMHDTFLMHMFECTGNLFHKIPDSSLVKWQILTLLFFDQLLQITPLGPFSDNDKFIVMYERVNVLDDMGVVQLFHNVDFFQTFLPLSLISHIKDLSWGIKYLYFFDGKGYPLFVLGAVDDRELPLSDRFGDRVALDLLACEFVIISTH